MPFKKALVARAPFPVTFVQQVAAGSLLTTITLFTNPGGAAAAGGGEYYEVLDVTAVWDVVSTSGTANVRNVPTATAATGGTAIITATFDLSATARAVQKAALATAQTTRLIAPGSAISLILGGTLTGLVGFSVTVWLQAFRGIRGR